MKEKRIKVPSGMARAAWDAMDAHARVHGPAVGCVPGSMCSLDVGLEAALRWLAENPITPTDSQFGEMVSVCRQADSQQWDSMTEWNRAIILCTYWQTCMLLAPEPEVPEEIADLMWSGLSDSNGERGSTTVAQAEFRIKEAFRRGQRSK